MIALENDRLRVAFDERGRVVSIIHKGAGNREILDSPAQKWYDEIRNDLPGDAQNVRLSPPPAVNLKPHRL